MELNCKYTRAAVLCVAAVTSFASVQMMHDPPRAAPKSAEAFQPVEKKALEKPALPSGFNFALAANGATVEGGSDPAQLIDGNDSTYTGGTGFATSQWKAEPPQAFVITLKDTVTIDCVRFLLWDRSEDRYYRYKLEVSPDDKSAAWAMIADRSGPVDQCRSWQTIRFKQQPVRRIRLTGTYNSANSGFHVVELQAYFGVPANAPSSNPDTLDF